MVVTPLGASASIKHLQKQTMSLLLHCGEMLAHSSLQNCFYSATLEVFPASLIHAMDLNLTRTIALVTFWKVKLLSHQSKEYFPKSLGEHKDLIWQMKSPFKNSILQLLWWYLSNITISLMSWNMCDKDVKKKKKSGSG